MQALEWKSPKTRHEENYLLWAANASTPIAATFSSRTPMMQKSTIFMATRHSSQQPATAHY